MTPRAAVYSRNPNGPPNTMYVKIDGREVYSATSINMLEITQTFDVGLLTKGAHTMKYMGLISLFYVGLV